MSSLHRSHANLCIVQNLVYVQPKQAQESYWRADAGLQVRRPQEQYRERMLGVWARWQQQSWEKGVLMYFEGRGKYLDVGVDLVHRKGEV